MGWGSFLDKILSMLPIQNRKERIKNKIDSLEKEQRNILNEVVISKNSARLGYIRSELQRLRKQQANFE